MSAEIILYIVFAILLVSFITSTIVLKKKNTNLTGSIIAILLEKAGEDKQTSQEPIPSNDGFVKFLSDSRDWAFTYIEEVQKILKKFVEEVGPEIEDYRNFGQAIESPHNKTLDKISNAYADLEQILPKDDSKK